MAITIEPTRTEADPDEKILVKARERFALCVEAEKTNRKRAKEALKFRNLEQWDESVRAEREEDPEGARPCMTMDKLNQHVRQVVNDERQNRPQIKISPIGEGADVDSAKIYDGLIRNMQDISNADQAYDTAFEHAVDGGFGYIRLITDYVDANSFEQDMFIKRVRNRFAVYLDPNRREADGSDAQYGFNIDKFSMDEYEAEYGKENVEDWDADGVTKGWTGEDFILVCEYFYIEPKKVKIVLLDDGSVLDKEEFEASQPMQQTGIPKQVIKERETTINEVKWCKLTYGKILEKKDWAGKYVPLIEVVGNELDIEGEVYKSGLIFSAMDAQRVYNYATSAFVENVALAPRAPWIAAEGQTEGQEEKWNSANRRNISTLTYKPMDVNGILVPPPNRLPPPGIPIGWQGVLQNAEHDIQSATGQYQASLGEESNEKSGKAILARAHEGDMGTFHYTDNLARALRFIGRQYIDLAPKILDTRRMARILNEDGTPEQITIDPDSPVAYQKTPQGIIFNPKLGKYGVTVTVGPAYTTRRKEAAEWQIQMIQAQPDLLGIIGDIVFRNQDAPGSEEIAERLKKTIPPQLLENDEDGEIDPAQVKAQLVEKDGHLKQAVETMHAMEAKIKSLESGEMSKSADAQSKGQSEIAKANAEVTKAEEQAKNERYNKIVDAATKIVSTSMTLPQEQQEGAAQTGADEMSGLMETDDEEMLQKTVEALMQIAQNTQASIINSAQKKQGVQDLTSLMAETHKAVTAPRQITLQEDDMGKVTGGISSIIN